MAPRWAALVVERSGVGSQLFIQSSNTALPESLHELCRHCINIAYASADIATRSHAAVLFTVAIIISTVAMAAIDSVAWCRAVLFLPTRHVYK
jgi:hypothetical protein